jgi:hypothetical protein
LPLQTTDQHTLPRLHVVGDSISIQYGPYLKSLLAGIVEYSHKTGENGKLSDPNGANGGDSFMVVDYLRSLRESVLQPIQYLMVNCGLHDIKRDLVTNRIQVPIEDYVENLELIISLARQLDGILLWARTTPVVDEIHNHAGMEFHRYATDVESYNTAADKIMARHRVASIDLFTFTQALGPSAYCDHVHYVDSVRAQQAAFIGTQIRHIIQKG